MATTAQLPLVLGVELQPDTPWRLWGRRQRLCEAKETLPRSQGWEVPELEPGSIPLPPPQPNSRIHPWNHGMLMTS